MWLILLCYPPYSRNLKPTLPLRYACSLQRKWEKTFVSGELVSDQIPAEDNYQNWIKAKPNQRSRYLKNGKGTKAPRTWCDKILGKNGNALKGAEQFTVMFLTWGCFLTCSMEHSQARFPGFPLYLEQTSLFTMAYIAWHTLFLLAWTDSPI